MSDDINTNKTSDVVLKSPTIPVVESSNIKQINPVPIVPPTSAEIEQALRERHQQNAQVENIPQQAILNTNTPSNVIPSLIIPVPPPPPAPARNPATSINPNPIIIQTNNELEQALKVQIENDLSTPSSLDKSDDLPGMVKLVIKLSGGSLNTQRQAEYVLLGICVLCITITVFLYSNMFSSTSKPTSPVMIQQMKNVNPSTAR